MKRTLYLGIALGALALMMMAVAPASQALDRRGTIRITTREVAYRVIDHGPRGRGPGDVSVSRTLLYNKGLTPRAIGHGEIVCTFTGRRSRVCNGTYFCPGGRSSFPERSSSGSSTSSPCSAGPASTTTCRAR
jgi:hypothetical protein